MTTQFRFIDRGHKDTMLLIPGWATDSQVFEPLDLPFNYLLPEDIPALFRLERGDLTDGLHLFGWSMGALIAARLAAKYTSIFKSVTLASVRPRFEKDLIEKVKGNVKRNRRAYLHKFYEGLFSQSEGENRRWFKTTLLERYMAGMAEKVLLEGLDYLSRTELECAGLARTDVTFVHGNADRIAPIEDIKALAAGMPHARFISIDGACHLPFLRKEFTDRFVNG